MPGDAGCRDRSAGWAREVARSAHGLHRSAISSRLYSAHFPLGGGSTEMNFGWYIVLVLVPSIAITGWAALRVRSTYAKWSKVDSGLGTDAFDFARRLLDRQGLTDVQIEPTPGQLTEHHDPRGKVLRVSQAVAGNAQLGGYDPSRTSMSVSGQPRLSVAAAAVIGHAG